MLLMLLMLGLGVWLKSIVECVRKGSDVALRCLPVISVRDLGSQRGSQPAHQCTHSFAFIVIQFTQTETRPTLRNLLWAHTHRSVDFSVVNVAHVVVFVHVDNRRRRHRSWRSHRTSRRGHCCRA